jgi:hypothetical protein
MKLAQWYAEREAQARRRIEWDEKLRRLGEALQSYEESLKVDPVSNEPVLQLQEKRGPLDQLVGFRVFMLGEVAFSIELERDASAARVIGVEDIYKGMAITNVVPAAGDDAELHFTTAKTTLPNHHVAKVSEFMLRVMETRLRAA